MFREKSVYPSLRTLSILRRVGRIRGIRRIGIVRIDDIRRRRRDGPEQSGNPTDKRPAQEQVQQKDTEARVQIAPAGDEGGQEVKCKREKETGNVEHRTVPPVGDSESSSQRLSHR